MTPGELVEPPGSPDASGRPRMARRERRDQLLDVAGHLFATLGYHHVSMDDIAEHAGVGKPVLYRHFPSKLDLYLAVVDTCGRDLLASIDASVAALQTGDAPGADGRDVVAAIARAYVSFVDVAGQATALLFESDVTHDEDARARVGRASSEAAARISAVLQQVATLSPDEVRTASAAIVAMAQGAAIHRMRHDDTASAAATADLVARLAWACVDGLVAGTA